MSRPCFLLTVPGGSCSLVVAHQLLISGSVLTGEICPAGMEARAQGLLPVPIPSFQPRIFREPSPKLTAFKAVAKRLLFSHLFSNAPVSHAQQLHCQGGGGPAPARHAGIHQYKAQFRAGGAHLDRAPPQPTRGHCAPAELLWALCTLWGAKVPVGLSSLKSWVPSALGLP